MNKGKYTDHYIFQKPQKPNTWFMYQIFFILARVGSVEDAAKETGLSYHYISKIISRLENSMNAQLFKRGKDGFSLTLIGKKAFEELQKAKKHIDHTTHIIELASQGIVDIPIKMAAPYAIGTTIIYPFSKDFSKSNPDSTMDLFLLNYNEQHLAYNSDCAIIFDKPTRKNFCCDYLFTLHTGIYASEAYLKKHGHPQNLKDIVKSNDIIPLRRKIYPETIIEEWERPFYNNRSANTFLVSKKECILGSILRDEGFGILSEMHTLTNPVKQVLQKYKGVPREVYFIYPEAHKGYTSIKTLRSYLLKITAPLRENEN